MNAKQITLACCVFAATVVFGADWVYDSVTGTVSDGVWTFGATFSNGGKLQVNPVIAGPDVVTPLDFSKPVTDGNGTDLYFNHFWRTFYTTNVDKRSVVGELTLPINGYTILTESFAGCANATGTIVFSPSLNNLGGSVFSGCNNIVVVGSSIPSAVTVIQPSTFSGCKFQGDVELPGVQTVHNNAFNGSGVGSVVFGPSLSELGTLSSDRSGPFVNCANLTNVVFDPASTVTIGGAQLFYGCSALKELDLTAVSRVEQKGSNDNHAHFYHCTALKKITFGSKLEYLDGRAFCGATALSEVVFRGPPPADLVNTYLYGIGDREVTTYVILDENATDYNYATAKAQWDALTAGGTINDIDSTWAAAYVGNVSLANRPLLLYSVTHVSIAATKDADEGLGVVGSFTVSRGEGESVAANLEVNYTVGGTAVAGQTYGALSGSVTIPAGSTSITVQVVPFNDPTTTSNTTVVVTLANGEYEIVAGHETATVNVINGVFPGWTYTITENNSGTMSKGGWSFAATHSGQALTVGAVTAWPDEISDLDFSPIVVGSDGNVYTIVGLNITGLGHSSTTTEPGSRLGRLVLPGEGLTSIGAANNSWVFALCTNAYGVITFPTTVNFICGGAFAYTPIEGDVYLPSLVKLDTAVFWNTKITSAKFGPALKTSPGANTRGPFASCLCLTNVVFDPNSKVNFDAQGATFYNCTALTDLDLSCVTNIAPGSYPRFQGCTSLTNITFGAGLKQIPGGEFRGATALQSIHFKGAAPLIIDNQKMFYGVGSSQTITTYVSVKFASVTNSAGLCWNDYVDGGSLGKTSTHWAGSYLYDGADPGHFPLLRIDSNALVIFVR